MKVEFQHREFALTGEEPTATVENQSNLPCFVVVLPTFSNKPAKAPWGYTRTKHLTSYLQVVMIWSQQVVLRSLTGGLNWQTSYLEFDGESVRIVLNAP